MENAFKSIFFLLTFYTLKSIIRVQKYKELWVLLCCGFVAKLMTLQGSVIPIEVKGFFGMTILGVG